MNFPKFTSHWVSATLGIPASDQDVTFDGIMTDSRKVRPGCLFVAIPGDTFDGHDFALQSLTQGAAGILVRKNWAPLEEARQKFPQAQIFAVEDTVTAYRALGGVWRTHYRGPVVMVAGAAGKTTTKELLTAILTGKFSQVLKTQGSQNGFVGIPMTLLELNASHGAAVIEVGIDEIGAMEQHFRLVKPDVVVLTAIGPEHLEKLRDLETVAREEGIAFKMAIESTARLAVNLDDPWIVPWYERTPENRRIGFSIKEGRPDPSVLRGKVNADFTAVTVGTENYPLPLPGKHNASNLLAAISCATLVGLNPGEIHAGLKKFSGAEGRSQLRELPGPLHVLCDYYNSQPASLAAGLELLAELATHRDPDAPRWACLGDMLELGKEEERYHREIAPHLMCAEISHVLLFGPRMKWLEEELREHGFHGKVEHFADRAALAASLIANVPPGSFVLIKGSRGMKMEEVWKPLEASRKK